jgi:hypothetical protein
LGVDLHWHKFSSTNSLYFSQNHQIFLQISAQIDELLEQHPEPAKAGLHIGNSRTEPRNPASKKFDPEKAGLKLAKAGPPARAGPRPAKAGLSCSQRHPSSSPTSSLAELALHCSLAPRPNLPLPPGQLTPTTPHNTAQRQPSHLMLPSIPSLDHAATAQNPLAPTSAALAQLPPDQLRAHK